MTKRIVVYSIRKEKARLAFGAAIKEIDPKSFDAILNRSIVFESNKSLAELSKIFVSIGLGLRDEFFIFKVAGPATGIGSAMDKVRVFK